MPSIARNHKIILMMALLMFLALFTQSAWAGGLGEGLDEDKNYDINDLAGTWIGPQGFNFSLKVEQGRLVFTRILGQKVGEVNLDELWPWGLINPASRPIGFSLTGRVDLKGRQVVIEYNSSIWYEYYELTIVSRDRMAGSVCVIDDLRFIGGCRRGAKVYEGVWEKK